jgi:ParB-like chromosome segregation protein Spo0J
MQADEVQHINHIAEDLRPLCVALDGLILDPDNARKHPVKSVEAIKASLMRFGQQKPVVLKADGRTVAAGNGTVTAARELGWTHVAAVRSNLSDAEATAFGLADNRTAEVSEWDFEKVSELLKDLQADEVDISTLGWADYELEPLLAADWSPAPQGDLPGHDEKKKSEHHIKIPTEKNQTVQAAVLKAREELENIEATEGEAIEHICKRYLELA